MILRTPSSPVWLKAFMLLSVCSLITISSEAQARKGKGRGNEIFTVVEHSASFPGGEKAFDNYLLKALRYPQTARDLKVQGKVFLTFVLEKNGSLSDVKVVKGIGNGCDEEAVRVIKASPKWIPARQRGHIVRQQYNVPIRFAIRRV